MATIDRHEETLPGRLGLKRFAPLLSISLLGVALWSLGNMLHHHRYHDIVQAVDAIPFSRFLLALTCAVLSYLIFVLYDVLALRHIRHPLPWPKIVFASFLGNAFTTGLGNSIFFGGPIRFRLYSSWGLSVSEIGRVVLFCAQTLWIGFMAIAGFSFLTEQVRVPSIFSLRVPSLQVFGVLLLLLVCAYLTIAVFRREPIQLIRWKINLPSPSIAVTQVVAASLDWAASAGVLYFLLPPESALPFPLFLGMFLLAQVIGLISQIPAGLGVFEWVILTLLGQTIEVHHTVGALIVFRFLYYFLPLTLAVLLLAAHELRLRKAAVTAFSRGLTSQIASVAPSIVALCSFIAGIVLLLSGATPAIPHRMEWLKYAVPLPIVEVSHFLGSIAGVGLLLLARGLQRRLDGAYLGAAILLSGGIAFSILKGLDYEEALILFVMLATLVMTRREFYRKSSFFGLRFSSGWWLAIIVVVGGSVWLGLFAFKHVEYTHDLWWQFTLHGHASRFLRASVGATVGLLTFAASQLVKPAPPKLLLPRKEELDQVAPIVKASKRTYAHLVFLGDKYLLFSKSKSGFIMFAVHGGIWVAMGDPVGPPEEARELIWEFLDLADDFGAEVGFYEVEAQHLPSYVDAGLTLLKLGEEARVPLGSFSLDGSSRKGFRHTVSKLNNEGCRFSIVNESEVPALLSRLQEISDAWLKIKNTREKGFSLGFFNESYLTRRPVAVVSKDNLPLAFANVWRGAEKEEYSVDLMRFDPAAPHGVMEYLLIYLMLHAKQDGYRWFNLGMAPLAGLNDHDAAPLWDKLGAFVYEHGERLYNFQGLRQYKDKFDPVWEPKYLATTSSSPVKLPLMLTGIATLISGGFRGLVAK